VGSALAPCCCQGVEGLWVLEGLSYRVGAVVDSVMAGQRRCSHCGLRYMSPWQRSEAVGEARPPRKVVKISG
jgi:hypothetical protein